MLRKAIVHMPGKYILVFEIESTEARDRYYPAPDTPSEEAQRASEGSTALFESWTRSAPAPLLTTL